MRRLPMYRLIAAAIALTLVPGAALADWGTTRWGMSPEDVIAAVPGATAVAHREGTMVLKHQMLATAPVTESDLQVEANFYFDPKAHKLAFIQFRAPKEQCDTYFQRVTGRYGKGKVKDEGLGPLNTIVREWTDPATRERLSYTAVKKASDNSSMYCHFMRQIPG